MASIKKVCRCGQSMLYTHCQQKPFQHAFNLQKTKTCPTKAFQAAKAIKSYQYYLWQAMVVIKL